MGMMINRRRACGSKKGLLPSGYVQLEYIENTSDAYIDTGVVIDSNSAFDVKFTLVTTTGYIYGSANDWNYLNNCATINDIKSTLTISDGSNRGPNIVNVSIPTEGVASLYVSRNEVVYNGTSYIRTIGYFTANNNCCLFCEKRPNEIVGHYKGSIYYFKLYNDGVLVRNFIPCKNPNNIVGMYDTVDGVFYSSPNGTAFVAGSEV